MKSRREILEEWECGEFGRDPRFAHGGWLGPLLVVIIACAAAIAVGFFWAIHTG